VPTNLQAVFIIISFCYDNSNYYVLFALGNWFPKGLELIEDITYRSSRGIGIYDKMGMGMKVL
jgi:hypothetical protein